MFKKTILNSSFAALAATLMVLGTSACSSVSTQPDAPSAEVPASAPNADDTVSNTTAPADVSAEAQAPVETADTQAPVINEPVADQAPAPAPTSLGASSSGRGH